MATAPIACLLRWAVGAVAVLGRSAANPLEFQSSSAVKSAIQENIHQQADFLLSAAGERLAEVSRS
jgi:hypothetical protein